jgi:hypothetical protein
MAQNDLYSLRQIFLGSLGYFLGASAYPGIGMLRHGKENQQACQERCDRSVSHVQLLIFIIGVIRAPGSMS